MKKSDFFCFLGGSGPGLRYFTARGKEAKLVDLMDFVTGEKRLKRPLELCLHGKRENDVIPGMLAFCVSQRFVDIMRKNAVSGWETYPVAMRTKEGKSVKDVFGLRVVGRAGPPSAKAERDNSADFNIKTWDGSDFFCLKDTALVLVTRKVANILTKEKISGASYRPITEL